MFKAFHVSFSAIVSAGITALSLFAGLPSAEAQTDAVRVTVPFAFEADGQQFAPGLYTIRMNAFNHMMAITGNSQFGQLMFFPDSTMERAAAGKIVFHRYGSQYFLREVWIADSKMHVHTLRPKAEKQLELAANATAKPENHGEELAVAAMPH